MQPEAPELSVTKENVCFYHGSYYLNDRDRDLSCLFELPKLFMKYSNYLTVLTIARVAPHSS